MSRILYSLLRAAQLQQQRHDLDMQQPVGGSRQRPRSWSTILMGAGIFAVVFGLIFSALHLVPIGGILLLAGTAAFVAGLVLMLVEVVLDLRR
jgi:hypothetical protein